MNTKNLRLVNAEKLLDMTLDDVCEYLEIGQPHFDVEEFVDELYELRHNSDHPMYCQAINDILYKLEEKLDAA